MTAQTVSLRVSKGVSELVVRLLQLEVRQIDLFEGRSLRLIRVRLDPKRHYTNQTTHYTRSSSKDRLRLGVFRKS